MTMRLPFVFLLFVILCSAKPAVVPWRELYDPIPSPNAFNLRALFVKFASQFNISRTFQAWRNFEANIKKIYENLAAKTTFTMGINKFAAMSPAEYRDYLGYRPELKSVDSSVPRHTYRKIFRYNPIPKFVDWRLKDYVTPVKDQGRCGSCWAFSATGSIEGQYKRASGKLVSLSEQQLVDCSFKFGNQGCNGGLMDNAFKYVKVAGGVDTEKDYPYVSGVTQEANANCSFNASIAVAKVTGLVDIPSHDEEALMEALAYHGPISIAINAGPASFMMYHSGIYDDPECRSGIEFLNHGVLLVGYGEENGVPYWLVKNSWGDGWGEKGYIRIKRTSDLCGVTLAASYPLI